MTQDRLPFVIDNQRVRLADVLNRVMRDVGGRALDVATAYFTVGGVPGPVRGTAVHRELSAAAGGPGT